MINSTVTLKKKQKHYIEVPSQFQNEKRSFIIKTKGKNNNLTKGYKTKFEILTF